MGEVEILSIEISGQSKVTNLYMQLEIMLSFPGITTCGKCITFDPTFLHYV